MKRRSKPKRRAGALVVLVMLGAVGIAQMSGIALVLPTGTIPGRTDLGRDIVTPGVISIWIKRGYDIHRVVREHGDGRRALVRSYEGPFDSIDIENGIDRFYTLSVPIGHEKARAAEYSRDRRIEVAQAMGLVGGLFALRLDDLDR